MKKLNTISAIMTTEFIELYPNMTVEESIENIRDKGICNESIYTCYVVEKNKLVGTITMKD